MKRQDRANPSPPVGLITGGSRGIGAACVRRFLAAGWKVSVLALPGAELEWLTSLGVLVTAGDITSEQTRQAVVHRTLASYGRIDLLMNNAGVGLYAPPTGTPSALFNRLLEVNVVAPLALAQLVIPIMREQGSGTIVTMSSVAARVPLPWAAAYSASKSALDSVHDSLRLELRRSSVHLLKVYPGIVDTEFRKHVLAGEAPEGVRNIRYVVSPDELAAAIFRAVNTRRKTLYVPAIGWVFSVLKILRPSLMDFYLARLLPSTELSMDSAGIGAFPTAVNED